MILGWKCFNEYSKSPGIHIHKLLLHEKNEIIFFYIAVLQLVYLSDFKYIEWVKKKQTWLESYKK